MHGTFNYHPAHWPRLILYSKYISGYVFSYPPGYSPRSRPLTTYIYNRLHYLSKGLSLGMTKVAFLPVHAERQLVLQPGLPDTPLGNLT